MMSGPDRRQFPGTADSGRDVDIHSPDGSVRIIASRRGDIGVEVRDLHRHTDESLAGQVRAAARVALAALQRPARDADPEVPGW